MNLIKVKSLLDSARDGLIEYSKNKVVYYTVVCPESAPIRGNLVCSGDDDFDKRAEDAVIASRDGGNEWAWCSVKVVASLCRFNAEGSDSLGCCSFDNKEDFIKNSGSYQDMCRRAYDDLLDNIACDFQQFWSSL